MLESFNLSQEGAAKAQIDYQIEILAQIRVLRDFILYRESEREGIDKPTLIRAYTRDLEKAREDIVSQLYEDHGELDLNDLTG